MLVWAHHKEQAYCVSIHMPRWASRITLEITDVCIERLQDISYDDCFAEGITEADIPNGCPVEAFCNLWESINGKNSWDVNPYVWRIEFKRILPVDEVRQ